MKIAYLPFGNDQQLIDMTTTVVETFHHGMFSFLQEQFDSKLRIHGNDIKILNSVKTSQQLYIFAHGSTGLDSIVDSSGNKLTVDNLVSQLVADGLSTDHKVIKLWACRGGDGGLTSTAARLKHAAKSQGFNNLTVYGYTQDLWSTSKGALASKQAGNSDDFKDAVRAKNVRVKF